MAPPHETFSSKENQRTLKQTMTIQGNGLFTGCKTTIKFIPAPEGYGIVFRRVDLKSRPDLPAVVENVRGTPRCTILGDEQVSIQTVEHLLSALKAFEIDNLLIEIDGPEVPSCDGSAMPFVQMIEDAGVEVQTQTRKFARLKQPIFWSSGDVHLIALPSEDFKVSYTLNYPNSKLLGAQFYTLTVSSRSFKEEIAPARTFSLYEEIVPLIEKGNIKGGSLENAVIIKDDAVLNPEGLRFQDEMVRHKILDLIGDLSLVGTSFAAHVIALRSGHFSNTSLAREISNYLNMGSK